MEYDESRIEEIYQANLRSGLGMLSTLQVSQGRKPAVTGLSGWIYEQTIRFCLADELHLLGHDPVMLDQVKLNGRAKLDLVVSKAAIEIKALGSYGPNGDEKYSRYKELVGSRGLVYLYLTRCETHKPYRINTISIFGEGNAFFLDDSGDWNRFVRRVEDCL